MNSMKKTAIAAALAFGVMGAAQAAPVVTFDFVGNFTMLSSGGGLVGDDPNVTGTMTLDFGTGMGSAAIASPQTFFGYNWTAHDITLQANMDGTVTANMLFDWGVNPDISVTVLFSMTPNAGGWYDVATMDGDGDGVLGNAMDNGPFIGFNATFSGQATPQAAPVPVPAAAWLLGSGLLGLVGVARRKYA